MHGPVFQMNTAAYKRNRTQKRKGLRRNFNPGDKIYYLDTDTDGVPTNTANYFPAWNDVPARSMDIIWAQNCQIFAPFIVDEIGLHFDKEELTDTEGRLYDLTPFLDDSAPIAKQVWTDLLQHAHRILKPGGKLVIPLPNHDPELHINDTLQVLLMMRILNMEANPQFIYKTSVVNAFTKTHTDTLRNLFIMNAGNLSRERLDDYKFIVFENS